jgi:hypothetical protein
MFLYIWGGSRGQMSTGDKKEMVPLGACPRPALSPQPSRDPSDHSAVLCQARSTTSCVGAASQCGMPCQRSCCQAWHLQEMSGCLSHIQATLSTLACAVLRNHACL